MKIAIQGVCAVALVWAATAATTLADPTAGGAAADTGLAEIIVTAEKRVESAQRAPLALTSISAEEIQAAHVTGANDITRLVPDVQVDVGGTAGDPGGANAVFTIRGLGASATGPFGAPGVAAHFDGIFRQTGLSNGEFFDLQRIEVAPGPQGTLYGRSAAAGAVNILPNLPQPNFAGEATIEAGNYGAVRTEAMLNLPAGSVLAFRGGFQTIKHDGYYSNGYDDEDSQAGRLQALLTPNDELSIRLYGDYLHLGGRGAGSVFSGTAGIPQLNQLLPQTASPNLRDRSISQYCEVNGAISGTCGQQVEVHKWTTHLDLEYRLGWGVLSVLPAVTSQTEHLLYATSPIPLSNFQENPFDQNETSVEVRLNDAGNSALKWVGGINYFYNHVNNQVPQDINLLTPLATPMGAIPGLIAIQAEDQSRATQRSYAAFGQVTVPIVDWLRATVGARYNHDTATYAGQLYTLSQQVYVLNGPLVATPVSAPIATGPLGASAAFNDTTYRLAIDADVGPHSIVYGSVGTGYKPGGLNESGPASANTPQELGILSAQLGVPPAQLAALAPSQTYGPEKVTHVEVGSKNRFWNNRLEINDALYWDDYKNYQNGSPQVSSPLLFRSEGFIVVNAGRSRVYGNELSAKFQATPYDLVAVSLNYLRAYFSSYLAPGYLTPNGPAPAANLSGYSLPNAPLFSGNLSYEHRFPLPDGGDLTAGLFTHLSDGYWTYFAESSGTYQPHYSSTTLDLTWRSKNGLWRISGFVKNLENKDVITLGQQFAGYSSINLTPPRTYGASITVKTP